MTLASLLFFVILPAVTEGISAVVLVDSIVSRSNRVAEQKFTLWMVESVSIHLKTS